MNRQSVSLGVVIGRFQVAELHEGHRHLIDYVLARHERVLVLIGHNDIRFTPRDPLPYEVRRIMLQEAYPSAVVAPLPDSKVGNRHWSQTVDELVTSAADGQEAILYGSRDSFIPAYVGRFPTHEVPPINGVSATALRTGCTTVVSTAEARRAWIAAIQRQYPITDSVVDMAVVSPYWQQVLLGRRGPGGQLGFFGGFLDLTDVSDEAAAAREQTEEVVGIEVGDPEYVGSCEVDDPRYRGSGYRLMTRFFVCEHLDGEANGADDMPLVEWVDLDTVSIDRIKPEHRPLFTMLLQYRSTYCTPDFGWD